jgi:hypothetical protein
MPAAGEEPVATTYEIVVKGDPGEAFVADLGARRFEPRRGMTVIVVDIIDQSHLQGVLARLHDSNVEVERVNPV